MPVHVNFLNDQLPTDFYGHALQIPGNRVANRSVLAVGAGKTNSIAAPQDCIVEIEATENAVFEIGAANAVDGATSNSILAGYMKPRRIRAGQIVSVTALP